METTGVQIKDQTLVFGVDSFPRWQDGAERCRLACLSFLFCQYWQYSSVYGCWIEDPLKKHMAYPMFNNEVAMNASNGMSVKAGEYIQHTCPSTLKREPLPLDAPQVVASASP